MGFLLSPCAPVHAGLLKSDVDFSNYNAPLYRQIVDRIKAKVATIKKRETKHLIPRAVGEAFLLQPVLDVRAKKFSGVGKVVARAIEMPD